MEAVDGRLMSMTEGDIETAVALVSRAMNADEGRWADRTMRFHFSCRSHALDDGRTYYVWRQDGAIRGLVGLHHVIWGPEQNVWLAWFAVDPQCQGRGLGRTLLAAAEKTATDQGYRQLLVETYEHSNFDKARRFYANNGFCQAGRIAGYLDDGSAMVIYAKRLV